MFTVEQIEFAHNKVKSGADFPKYIREIKELGVMKFETWVIDSHTKYFGKDNFQAVSKSKYEDLSVSDNANKNKFEQDLKSHQQGGTDYLTFCKDCAEAGIEKWIVDLEKNDLHLL